MTAPGRGAMLRWLAAAARRGALTPLPEGITADEAAAALDAGADALGEPAGAPLARPQEGRAGARVRIRVDGGSRGNPGPAGFGAILEGLPDGPRITHCAFLGTTTSNVAEYQALVWALAEARRRGFEAAEVLSDSELMVKQMRGDYRVQHPRLKPLHARAASLAHGFRSFHIRHVPRAHNSEADVLANRAIDEGLSERARRHGAASKGE